jgi:O-antigen/teichoic acid export membrane protein
MIKWWQFLKKQKQIQDFSIYGFGQFFNLVTPLLVAPYLISICGEANFGKIAVGMALSFFLIVFIDFGSDLSGVREVSVYRNQPQKLKEILVSTYILRFFSLIFVLTLSTILFFFVPYFKEEKSLFFLSLSIVVGQFFNPIWFLQGLEKIKNITVLNILSKTLYLSTIFIFIKKPEDYVYVNLFWGFGMCLVNFVALLILFKNYNKFKFILSWNELGTKFKSDFSIFSAQIFVSIQMYAPVFLLSFLGSNIMAGQYKIIEQVINVFKTYILLFFNFVFPKVCVRFHESNAQGLKVWGVFNGINAIFIVIMMAVIYFFSMEVVAYFKPENIDKISDLLKIAVFIPIIIALSNPMKQVVLAKNKNKQYVFSVICVVTLSTIALFFVVPTYEVLGMIWVIISAELVFLFVLVGLVYQIIKNESFKSHQIN